MILKVGYYSAYMEESMEKYNPFKRELFFYQDVMPKIEGLLLSVGDNGDLSEKYAIGAFGAFCDYKVYKQKILG